MADDDSAPVTKADYSSLAPKYQRLFELIDTAHAQWQALHLAHLKFVQELEANVGEELAKDGLDTAASHRQLHKAIWPDIDRRNYDYISECAGAYILREQAKE